MSERQAPPRARPQPQNKVADEAPPPRKRRRTPRSEEEPTARDPSPSPSHQALAAERVGGAAGPPAMTRVPSGYGASVWGMGYPGVYALQVGMPMQAQVAWSWGLPRYTVLAPCVVVLHEAARHVGRSLETASDVTPAPHC